MLDAGGTPRLLLRGGESHPKAAALAPLLASGARVAAADLAEPASLAAALAGAAVIVPAVQGGPEVIIDGERALALAGMAEGALQTRRRKRMSPGPSVDSETAKAHADMVAVFYSIMSAVGLFASTFR